MLFVKKSNIPKAGKGLFVAKDIKKGEIITEYEGERLTWKECKARNEKKKGKEKGAYYFYINEKNCIDAEYCLWAMGRYANDAAGIGRVKGLRNNSQYQVIKNKAYIVATRNIKKGSEVFVSYGKAYWDAMKDDN
ncbi:MAG: SET domain-containing protein-lysine N-methyltransferase [Bacteroidia bacterium]|nr:SET domain-containing protein-lysine N-methyltransferase [Bacteroidia bacterium]MCC7532927.1 SET domain-containing protein-lysine N-methyltransferase [Bacteroidia bacterium]